MQRRLIAVDVHRDAISLFYLQRLIYHVFEMSAFACFEWCTPVVNIDGSIVHSSMLC